MRAIAVMLGEEQDRCWDDLHETVRTGETAFDRLYGQPIFDYLGRAPRAGQDLRRRDDRLQRPGERGDARCLRPVGRRDPGRRRRRSRVRTWPASSAATRRCGACSSTSRTSSSGPARVLKAAGVLGRCAVEAGDFFETAPVGADAYMLGHIIHDWDDAKAGLILDNLRRAMPAGAQLPARRVRLARRRRRGLVRQVDSTST